MLSQSAMSGLTLLLALLTLAPPAWLVVTASRRLLAGRSRLRELSRGLAVGGIAALVVNLSRLPGLAGADTLKALFEMPGFMLAISVAWLCFWARMGLVTLSRWMRLGY